jgi:outer membrane lipoprotein SlyB
MAMRHPIRSAPFRLLSLLWLPALAACALNGEYEPVVDMTGHTKSQYDYDLLVCRENAKQPYIAGGLVFGALGGAALGAGIGALTGSAGTGAAIGAGAGAVGGAAAGSLYGPGTAQLSNTDPLAGAVRRCLEERGYKVLDPEPAEPSTAATPQP